MLSQGRPCWQCWWTGKTPAPCGPEAQDAPPRAMHNPGTMVLVVLVVLVQQTQLTQQAFDCESYAKGPLEQT